MPTDDEIKAANTQELDNLQNRIDELEDEVGELKAEVEALEADKAELRDVLTDIETLICPHT